MFASIKFPAKEKGVWRVDGDSADGVHFWSYVAVDKPKFPAFKKALDTGSIRVQDYGIVLMWGAGDAPPKDAKQYIKKNFDLEVTD